MIDSQGVGVLFGFEGFNLGFGFWVEVFEFLVGDFEKLSEVGGAALP